MQETDLKRFAAEIRLTTMKCIGSVGEGHIGGSFSLCEMLAVLYGKYLKYDPKNPEWEGRDRVVSSKGHAGPAYYSVLALRGFFPMDWLNTLNRVGTRLPSHCDRNLTPGIDMSTGSLGQGISPSVGMAIALKNRGTGERVYCVIGDGETNEGQIWEAIMLAVHMKLNNWITFVDRNHGQVDGLTKDVLDIGNLVPKFESFGCYVKECDGHDVAAIDRTIAEVIANQNDKPGVIVLNTIKGYGAKSIVDLGPSNHNIRFNPEQYQFALAELEEALAAFDK